MFALGDVKAGAGHANRCSIFAPLNDLAVIQYPYPVPGLVPYPHFTFVNRKLGIEALSEELIGLFKIMGMRQLVSGVDTQGGQFLQGVAGNLRPAIIKSHLAGPDAPVPQTYPGSLDGKGEPPLALSQ
jgi:hypothetical protein